MEYLSLQDLPHRQHDSLHSHRMTSISGERPMVSMAAAVSSPPSPFVRGRPSSRQVSRAAPYPSRDMRSASPRQDHHRANPFTISHKQPYVDNYRLTHTRSEEESLRKHALNSQQNAQMRSSPPIQPNESGYADKLPSFSEFLSTTRAPTPPRTPSRRQGSSDSSPCVRPQFEDVSWHDGHRGRSDTLGDIYAPPRSLHAASEASSSDQRRMSGAVDHAYHSRHHSPSYASESVQQHRPSYSYPTPHGPAPSHAHSRHHSSPAPPPHSGYRQPSSAFAPQPAPHSAGYEHRQPYYPDAPPPPPAHSYPYDRPQDAYFGRSSYAAPPYPGYEHAYNEVRFHHNVGIDPNAFSRKRRGNLPKEATNILKTWFHDHRSQPYPTEDQKIELCHATQLSMNQVSNWFINARRRAPQKEAREREANGQPHQHQ